VRIESVAGKLATCAAPTARPLTTSNANPDTVVVVKTPLAGSWAKLTLA
jgi:hypothetical protein